MADYTFFTNPMSRGQIARWALHEAGADYEDALVPWDAKPKVLLQANPMGKVPTIIHHVDGQDRVVSEAAAICAYLAEMHPEAGLLPNDAQMADYFRWFFFAAGPVESAVVSRALKFEPADQQQMMAGWGSFDLTMDTLEGHLSKVTFVCGEKFTAADIYLGSQVDWGLTFGTIPPEGELSGDADLQQARPAYKAAKAVDNAIIVRMKQ